MNTEKLLAELVERLLKTYSRDLRSVVLYGSAATGDFHQKHSDLNVLCVVRALDVEKLEKYEPIANWWRGAAGSAPLLLSEEELERGSDSFAIEFLDMQAQNKLLHGEDLLAEVSVDPGYHRVQVEHELRTKLLALRHRYLGIHRDQKAVTKLMADALPSFSTLFRHALLLCGMQPGLRKQEVLEMAAKTFEFEAGPFLAMLDLRRGERGTGDLDARASFRGYYEAIVRVTKAVDALQRGAGNLS